MKIVIGLLAAAILGTGGFAFAAGVDDTQPGRTVSLPGTTTAATTAATTTDDIVVGNLAGSHDHCERQGHLRPM